MNPQRKPIIAGNWKMYKTAADALALVSALKKEVAGIENVEVVVCPQYTALYSVSTILQVSDIKRSAQNVHWEKEGAFTGESAPATVFFTLSSMPSAPATADVAKR